MKAASNTPPVPIDRVNLTMRALLAEGRTYISVGELMKIMLCDMGDNAVRIHIGLHLNTLGGVKRGLKVRGCVVTIWKIRGQKEPFCNEIARKEADYWILPLTRQPSQQPAKAI